MYCSLVEGKCECTCFKYQWLAAATKDGSFFKLKSKCKARASEVPIGRTIYGVLLEKGEMVLEVVSVPRVVNLTLKPEGNPPAEWRQELRDRRASFLRACRRAKEILSSTSSDDYW